MNRKNTTKNTVVILTVFTLLSSSLAIVSSSPQEPLIPDEEINRIIKNVKIDGNKALNIKLQVSKITDTKIQEWTNELTVFTGETIRFKATIKNQVNYNLENIRLIDTLPPQDKISLIQDSIYTSKPSISQVIENKLLVIFDELLIGEEVYIEYDMLALSETTLEGIINTITAASDFDLQYYQEIELMNGLLIEKTNSLKLINIEVSEQQTAYNNLIKEIEIINNDITSTTQQIAYLDPQIINLNEQISSLTTILENINTQIPALNENMNSINQELNVLDGQIISQQVVVQNLENMISEQTLTIQNLQQNLGLIDAQIQTALESSDADQEYIQNLITQKTDLENQVSQIAQGIQISQNEIATEQESLDEMMTLQSQLITEIQTLTQNINENTQSLEQIQTQHQIATEQLNIFSNDLSLKTHALADIQNNFEIVTQQIAQSTQEYNQLIDQQSILRQDLQDTMQLIDSQTQILTQFQTDYQITIETLESINSELNFKISALQTLQDSIQLNTHQLNNLISLEADLLLQETQSSQLLQNTIQQIDAKTIELNQLQTQNQELENQILFLTNDLSAATQNFADTQVAIQLKTQQMTQNIQGYNQLINQQATVSQQLQQTTQMINTKTQNLQNLQLQYQDTIKQIENLNSLNVAQELTLQDTISQISIHETLLLEETNNLFNLEQSLSQEKVVLIQLEQQLQQEIADQQINNEELNYLEIQIAQQKNTITNTQNKMETSQNLQSTLQADIEARTIQQNQLTQNKKLANTQINLKNQQADQLSLQIQNYDVDILNLEQTLSDAQATLISVSNQISQNELLFQEGVILIENLEQKLSAEKTNKDNFNVLLQNEISNQEINSPKLTDLENQITQQSAIVVNLQDQKAAAQNLQSTLQADIETLTIQQNQLTENIALNQAQITSDVQLIQNHELDLSDVNNDIYVQEEALSQKQLLLQDADTQIYILDTKISDKTVELNDNQIHIDEKEIQIQIDLDELNVLCDEKILQEQAVSNLQAQLDNLIMEPELNEEQITQTQKEIADKQLLTHSLNVQINRKTQEIIIYMVEKDDFLNDQIFLQQEYDLLASRLNVELECRSNIDADIQTINLELQGLYDTKLDTQSNIQFLEDEITSLNADIVTYEQNLVDTIATIGVKQIELQNTLELITSLQHSLTVEQETLARINQDYTQLVSELSQNNDIINGYLSQIADSETLINNLNAQIQTAISEKTTIQITLYQLNTQKNSLNDNINSASQQMTFITQQKQQAELQLQRLQTETQSLETFILETQAEIQVVSDEIVLKQSLLQTQIDLSESLAQTLAAEQIALSQFQDYKNQLLSDLFANNGVISNLIASISNQESYTSQIQQQLDSTKLTITNIQSTLNQLNLDKSLARDNINSLTQQITISGTQETHLSSTIAESQNELDILTADKLSLQDELADINVQIANNQEAASVLQNEFQELSLQEQLFADEKAIIQGQITVHESKIGLIEPQILSYQNSLNIFSSDKISYEQTLADLKAQILENQQNQLTLQNKLNQLAIDDQTIQAEISAFESQKTSLEDILAQLDPQIQSKALDLNALSSSKITYEQNLENIQALILANQDTGIALQTESEALSQQEQTMINEISALKAEIVTLTTHITQFESDMQSLQITTDDLSSLKIGKEGDLNTLNNDLAVQQNLITDKNSFILDQQLVLTSTQNELSVVSAKLDATIQDINENQAYIKDLLNQKSSIENDLTQNIQIMQTAENNVLIENSNLNNLLSLQESKFLVKQTLISQLDEQETSKIQLEIQINDHNNELQSLDASSSTLVTQLNDLNSLLESNTRFLEQTIIELQRLGSDQIIYEQEIDTLQSDITNYEQNLHNIDLINQQTVIIHILTNPNDMNTSITIDKKAFNTDTSSWEDTIVVQEDEIVRFRINVTNNGEVNFIKMTVNDILPSDILTYYGNPIPYEPDMGLESIVWTFKNFNVGDTITVEFDALATNMGLKDNVAKVSAIFEISNEINNAFFVNKEDLVSVKVLPKPVNHPPVANDDYYDISKNSVDNTLNVLENDTDEDYEDQIKITQIRKNPEHGTVTYDDNFVYYTPDTDYIGQDFFEYMIIDNSQDKDAAMVHVNVLNTNHAPVANDDDFQVLEDSSYNILDVLVNDTDDDSEDILSIHSITTGPSHGNAYIDSGAIVYTPDPNFSGLDTLNYVVSDGSGQDNAEVAIYVENINDAPVAVTDNVVTPENTSVEIYVLNNDYDIDGDVLTIDGIDVQPEYGSVNINSNVITYTPNPGYNGSDSFVYNISDENNGYSTAIVDIDVYVIEINHPPVAVDDTCYIYINSTNNALNVLSNDYDIDKHELSIVSIDILPSNGTVSINGKKLIYTPDVGFNGSDSLTYNITDGMGGFDTAVVTINTLDQTSIIIKPAKGSAYLWDDEILNSAKGIMESIGCDAFTIGPITITTEVNESKVFDVDFVEFYLDDELIESTSNLSHSFVFSDRVLGFYTLKVVIYGEERTITEELELFMINFGFYV